MSKEHFTLDDAIAHCYEVSKKKDICKECADEHLQLAKWLKELKTLRQEKNGTADSGWSPTILICNPDCSFCYYNDDYRGWPL